MPYISNTVYTSVYLNLDKESAQAALGDLGYSFTGQEAYVVAPWRKIAPTPRRGKRELFEEL
jgi:hypothetical protein